MTETFDLMRALRGDRYEGRTAMRRCSKHGEYEVREFYENGEMCGTFGADCGACVKEAEALKREQEEERREEERLHRRIDASQIPFAFQSARFATFSANQKSRPAFDAVEDWAESFPDHCETGRSLVLLGSPGVGKSHLAIASLWRVIEGGYSGRYTTLSELVRSVRATWRRDSGLSESEVLDEYCRPALLVLDEVGVSQSRSDNELGMISEVIDTRYRSCRPTIVVGNVDLKGLEANLGERAVDRLLDHGGQIVPMSWPSYRRKRPIAVGAAA